MIPERPGARRLGAVAMVAAAVLGTEVALTRAIAITQWHDLAPVVVALAMLGFAAAAVAATLLAASVQRRPGAWALASALALAAAIPLGVSAAQRVPLNVLRLLWTPAESGWLLLYCACFLLPLAAGGLYLTVALARFPGRAGLVYGFDLAGSAAGAATAMLLIGRWGPEAALRACCLLAACAAALHLRAPAHRAGGIVLAAAAVAALSAAGVPELRMTDRKELPQRLGERDARVLVEADSALARLAVVESPGLHAAPGLSLAAAVDAPPQHALFLDGHGGAPLLGGPAGRPDPAALRATLGAAPHAMAARRSVLILHDAGTWEAWTAQVHATVESAPRIEVVHPDAEAARLVEPYLPPGARLRVGDPRRVLEGGTQRHDLVLTRVLDLPAGVPAARESYDWTVEAFESMLDALAPGGAVAAWTDLQPLPRDLLRIAATAAVALERRGSRPRDHVAVLRDWQAGLLIATRDPLGPAEIARLREHARRWSFDLEALPDLAPDEIDRFHARPGASHQGGLAAILEGPAARERFLADYVLDVRPATDDRPFFHRSFRWSSIGHLRATLGPDWLRHAGWGYFLGVVALAALLLLGGAIVGVPLLLRARGLRDAGIAFTLAWFGGIGLGFMGIEIALLQAATLVVGTPLASVGVVLASLLVGAGAGSLLLGGRTARRTTWLLAALVAAGAPATLAVLHALLRPSAEWPLPVRALAVAALLATLALPMGAFLPQGLARVREAGTGAVAWAFGVNGLASVAGALGASLLAMHVGFTVVMLAAGACYLAVALAGHLRR